MGQQDPADLEDVIGHLTAVAEAREEVSIGDIQEAMGRRSFAPFLIIPSLIEVSPIGGIPGVPTAMATIVATFAVQLLFGKKHFWLPRVIRKRHIKGKRLKEALDYVEPVARRVDKVIRARLTWATREPFIHLVAAVCLALTFVVPPLEVVPFASSAPMGTVGLLGLALIARDGLLVLIGLGLSLGAFYLTYSLLLA